MSKTFVYSKTKIIHFISFCCYTINIMELNQQTQNKIKKIKELGINNLCIISEFDKTITCGIDKQGIYQSCSFSVYRNNPELLGKNYQKETDILFEKYYTIEQSSNYTNKEKEKYMIEWWKKEFDLYKKYNFKNKTINTIIDNNLIELRSKTNQFFKLTNQYKIPTIIFSAGIYNLIDGFIKKTNNDFDNIHIVGNQFIFDKNDKFQGTTGDVIHSQNKTFTELSHLPVYKDLQNKKTCILIGDSPSDTKMVEGNDFDIVLKIGFLNTLEDNSKYENRLNGHNNCYDIIIPGYEDFSKINSILEQITN
jgi:HAD superfamily hydrolase (TIGR01544 family)